MNDVKRQISMAKELLDEARIDAAQSIILALEEQYPGQGDVLMLKGELALREGNWEKAENDLQQALKCGQEKGRIWFSLGNAAALQNKDELAVERYLKARDAGFSATKLELNLATCYEKIRQADAAEQCYRTVLAKEPAHHFAAVQLIKHLISSEDLDKAFDAATDLIERYPERFDGVHFISAILMMQNNPESALLQLERVKERFQNLLLFWYDYVRTLNSMEKYEQAYECLLALGEQTVEEIPLLCREKARVFWGLNRMDMAKETLERLCNRVTDQESFYMLGLAYLKTREYRKAADWFSKSTQLHIGNAECYMARYFQAEALAASGQTNEAKKVYEDICRDLKRVAKQSLLPLHVQAIYIHSLLASGREKEAYAVANYMENLANEMLKAGTLQQ